jgi:hypothetical protein
MSSTGEVEHVAAGISGHVGRYDVFVANDLAIIIEDVDGGRHVRREIDRLGEFVKEAEAFRLGWGEFPDFEVVYLYDRADDGFGYAVNLDSPRLSEWGYAPFELEPEE